MSLAATPEPVEISNAWARATVEGQPTGSAFMTILAHANVSIVGAESPAAQTVQLHEMAMQGSTMTMRELPRLDMKAGDRVTLDPGARHIMLFGLKGQLKAGEHFPVTLLVQQGTTTTKQTVEVEVRPLGK
jgi:copper(I)-binding protein